jgi:hypothetical protein
MSIRYFHLVDNEVFSNRTNIVNGILEVEYEGEDSAWCVMLDGKPIAVSENFNRVKNWLEYSRMYPHDNI